MSTSRSIIRTLTTSSRAMYKQSNLMTNQIRQPGPSNPSRILSQIPFHRHYASPAPLPPSPTPSTPRSSDTETLRLDAPGESKAGPQPIGKIEPRLQMTFTCTADECGHRSTHEFSKRSYKKGIVLVQCPSCKNRHLIADNLGWFNESTGDGKMRTVEDLLRAKGEKIRKGRVGFDGDIEIDGEDEGGLGGK